MTSGSKRLIQKTVAVIVIVALLNLVGVSTALMFFVTGVVVIVWLVSRQSQSRELREIFDFFVEANDVLRDQERRWFAFELADVIERGERALDAMPDPPPLQLFALGALHQKIGNHDATVEYLSRLVEMEFGEEYRNAPSPQLRRYVSMLRELEKDPALSPLALGAVRSLERLRRRHAFEMLSESRVLLKRGPVNEKAEVAASSQHSNLEAARTLSSVSVPPPISEVLHDIYHDDFGAPSDKS